ncbi:DUF202 domain-containing protein [Nocardioides sp. HDW12B]|uniref:DUF202 domain-containing protein n=1 Tax=Nocardioides sp. HDW12B TaxID=2714939 RepID=UPI0014098892|nr:DUF202 domain-containing protein [Nocardioides sp. HDW12B]QIK67533.1 DUF202 domain-containing protein [Nocardioides sp. HDW12B]
MSEAASGFAERTVMAWQRTSLAIVTLALLQLRLTSGHAPGVVLGLLGLAAVMAALAGVEARRRDRGGRVGLLLTSAVVLLTLVELGIVLS